MNNNPQNNGGDIDDILEVLRKRKEEDAQKNPSVGELPTRVDNDAVKKADTYRGAGNKTASTQKKQEEKSSGTSSAPQQKKSSSASTISLSDFDNIKSNTPERKPKKKKFRMPGYAKILIYLIVVFAVSIFISCAVINIANDTFAFVKPDKEITVSIKEGATLEDVSKELYEKQVIKYPTIYRIYTKIKFDRSSYYSGSFISGEHTLNSNLGYDKLMSMLAESAYTTEVVRVTIPEGYTVHEIIDLFIEKRVISKDKADEFKDRLNTAAFEYDFLSAFDEVKDENGKVESDRIYLLEGYLFPDTYDFYVGENHDSIISKLLNNFDKKFEETYYQRCQDLGLTIDEVITIASMIEAEGNRAEDFYKISSVFHNRIKNKGSFPFLNSDATTLYSFQGEKKKLDAGDNQSRVHPYNTYLNKGLPPGPICNPGTEAIHAALYPESTNYYYFYTASSNGVTYYSSNESQHNSYIQKDRNGTLK